MVCLHINHIKKRWTICCQYLLLAIQENVIGQEQAWNINKQYKKELTNCIRFQPIEYKENCFLNKLQQQWLFVQHIDLWWNEII